MNKVKLFSLLVIILLVAAGGYVLMVANAQPARAAGTVTYHLFATDGYIRQADHGGPDSLSPTYIYGFVGGRSNVGLKTYDYSLQTAVNYDPDTLGSAQPAPAPAGGMVTAAEMPLTGKAQFPAPAIWATKNDVVEIRLKNLGVWANPTAPNDPHSIHLHGLDVDAANDGVPETSVGAVPSNLCNNGSTDSTAPYNCDDRGGMAPGAGNVVVYMFTARTAGTTMYHCHQEADIHVQMGMYGALVVYDSDDPAGNVASSACTAGKLGGVDCGKGPGSGVGGVYNGFKYDKDVIMLLSEMDSDYHWAEEGVYGLKQTAGLTNDGVKPWNPIDYVPEYWYINGLSFPNTIGVSNAGINMTNWLAVHPEYNPLIQGSVSATTWASAQYGEPGEKILLRMINMGFETQPMHIHGYHLKVLGNDQRPWPWANKVAWGKPTPFNQGLEKNTILIGSGETYELLLDMGQQATQSTYEAGVQSRYYDGTPACQNSLNYLGIPFPSANAPVTNKADGCPPIPDAGDPANIGSHEYIGGPTVVGAVGLGGTAQLFPFHNHDDYKATNNGSYPGGMFTMVIPLP